MTDQSGVSTSDLNATKMPVGGYIDYEHRQYVSPVSEVRLTLKPLSKLVLERLYNNQDGKPKVPIIEVEIGGKFKAKEANPEDPEYKDALAKWQSDKNLGLARYLILNGIFEDVPDDFAEEYREYAPAINGRDLKYLWVLSVLGETDDQQTEGLKVLTEGLFGMVAPTEQGMREAEETFRSNGREHSSDPIPDGQIAG